MLKTVVSLHYIKFFAKYVYLYKVQANKFRRTKRTHNAEFTFLRSARLFLLTLMLLISSVSNTYTLLALWDLKNETQFRNKCWHKGSYRPSALIYSSSSSSVIFQTTGPKPLPKRFCHIVRSRASSFNWQYPLLSLRIELLLLLLLLMSLLLLLMLLNLLHQIIQMQTFAVSLYVTFWDIFCQSRTQYSTGKSCWQFYIS